jgi:hypothetical protein
MSSDFTLHSATASQAVQAPPPVAPPKPPKSQSDHKPANEATSSRGPAVVLSGAFAKSADKSGQSGQNDSSSQGQSQGQGQGQSQGQSQTASTGQHVNHVI